MPPIVEYNLHKAPVQLETLRVVQYLHSLGIDLRPTLIFERNHSERATSLPAIHDVRADEWHVGIDACLRFYEKHAAIENIMPLAADFSARNQGFRINW
jgi:hypothetical protein